MPCLSFLGRALCFPFVSFPKRLPCSFSDKLQPLVGNLQPLVGNPQPQISKEIQRDGAASRALPWRWCMSWQRMHNPPSPV